MNLRNLVDFFSLRSFTRSACDPKRFRFMSLPAHPSTNARAFFKVIFSQCVCKLYVYKISKKISSLFDKKTNSSSKPSKKKEINIPKSAAPMLLLDIKKPKKSMKKKKKSCFYFVSINLKLFSRDEFPHPDFTQNILQGRCSR